MNERIGGDDRVRERMEEQRAAERQEVYLRQRRTDAIGIATEIADPRLKRREIAMPAIIEFINSAGGQITTYEAEPIKRALFMKAQEGLVQGAHLKNIQRIDEEMALLMIDRPGLMEVLAKVDGYDPKYGDFPDLTLEEETDLALCSEKAEERDWIVDTMTNGVGKMMRDRSGLEKRKRRLEGEVMGLEGRAGDLDDSEREEYESLLKEQLKGLSDGEKRSFSRLNRMSEEEREGVDDLLYCDLLDKMDGVLSDEDNGRFYDLLSRKGYLSRKERTILQKMKGDLRKTTEKLSRVKGKLGTVELPKAAEEWMVLHDAFSAMVDNVNVTDQWRKAWHDLHEGGVNLFVQTRWADYQTPSEMAALLSLPGAGEAMELAFKEMARIAMSENSEDVAINLFRKEKAIKKDVDVFLDAVKKKVRDGGVEDELYVNFGVDMARMLFENSLLSGWFGFKRDESGEIVYKWDKEKSSDFGSEAYKYGEPASKGDGTLYPDRNNDYIKLVASRVKMMIEAERSYPTGLPGLVSVLPDCLAKPWIGHDFVREIVASKVSLKEVFEGAELRKKKDGTGLMVNKVVNGVLPKIGDDEKVGEEVGRTMKENSRWGWSYGVFRSTQVYETYVSEFVIGLKGFRDIVGEAEFFLKSASNLAALKKKVEAALGENDSEAQRFVMNLSMAILYGVTPNLANPLYMDEKKSFLTEATQGMKLPMINFKEDDYARIFGKFGLLSMKQWKYVWARLINIDPGKGGEFGKAMIKKGERGVPYLDKEAIKALRKKIRIEYVKSS